MAYNNHALWLSPQILGTECYAEKSLGLICPTSDCDQSLRVGFVVAGVREQLWGPGQHSRARPMLRSKPSTDARYVIRVAVFLTGRSWGFILTSYGAMGLRWSVLRAAASWKHVFQLQRSACPTQSQWK